MLDHECLQVAGRPVNRRVVARSGACKFLHVPACPASGWEVAGHGERSAGWGLLMPHLASSQLPGGENIGLSHPEGPPHRLQQPAEQRHQPVRKVTLTKGTVQQPHQHQPHHLHQLAQIHSALPQGLKNIPGIHPAKKVLMHGRGRGMAGQMGRGRLMPNKQNLRVVECRPQPCVVSVEGLSSSTTDVQLKNLLMSVGPIQHLYLDPPKQPLVKRLETKTVGESPAVVEREAPNLVVEMMHSISCKPKSALRFRFVYLTQSPGSLQMLPQQRKAIAKFKEPADALKFQQKFHRHMIDLSHINVALIVE
ncbi:UNVERIFIED_CONTAM: hypothetical protein K2H54_015754 [Gekko kuhli]